MASLHGLVAAVEPASRAGVSGPGVLIRLGGFRGSCRTAWCLAQAVAAVGLLAAGISSAYADYQFTTLDDPLAAPGTTYVNGVSGGTVVGYYGSSGFSESGGTYTPLGVPGATVTEVNGISGTTIVGTFETSISGPWHGFIKVGSSFTTLTAPGESYTGAGGIYGNTVVGIEQDSTGIEHGFMETGGNYTRLDMKAPAVNTIASGIYGNTVVGTYWGSIADHEHGFMETGGSYTAINFPGARDTWVSGISGSTIVGSYDNTLYQYHGFMETGGVFTTLDFPGATTTNIQGIDGSTLVGTYTDSVGTHGFIAVPEPTSLTLVGAGVAGMLMRRRRRGFPAAGF